MKPTLVIGASENPERYAYKAIQMLLNHHHMVYAYSLKSGNVSGVEFSTKYLPLSVHTVTMYVGAANQTPALKEYIEGLRPQRVLFNPGTENPEWEAKLTDLGIQAEEACTLVLLQTEQF